MCKYKNRLVKNYEKRRRNLGKAEKMLKKKNVRKGASFF